MAIPFIGDVLDDALDLFGVADTDSAGERIPRTRTVTSHALTIRVGGGIIIGAINGFSHTQTRTLTDEWELGNLSHGTAPIDIVPGNLTTRKISIKRYDLYTANMEQAFSRLGEEWVSLTDQTRPFTLRTAWRTPKGGIVLADRRVYEYTGCWFSDVGRQVSATDSRVVNADAQITYTLRRRLL